MLLALTVYQSRQRIRAAHFIVVTTVVLQLPDGTHAISRIVIGFSFQGPRGEPCRFADFLSGLPLRQSGSGRFAWKLLAGFVLSRGAECIRDPGIVNRFFLFFASPLRRKDQRFREATIDGLSLRSGPRRRKEIPKFDSS